MDIIKKLRIPDYVSFVALFFAWISIVLVVQGEPNWAIALNCVAFAFDLLDGYAARRFKLTSQLGRYIDSTVDIFTYIIFSSLFFFVYLSPHFLVGILGGFLIIIFGILRLIRFNSEGILTNSQGNYYRGVTVVHINLIIFLGYFLLFFTPFWNNWLTAGIIFLASPLMLSNYKSYKWNSLIYCVIGLSFLALSMLVEFKL